MDYLNFSKKEWEILICFWNAQEPLCCSDFSERFNLNCNTSLSVIRKLVNKGILEVASIKMSGSVLARRFQPKVTELEVLQSILNQDQIFAMLQVAIGRLEENYCQKTRAFNAKRPSVILLVQREPTKKDLTYGLRLRS